MKCYFIVNPKAGAGETAKKIAAGIKGIADAEIYYTKAVNDATAFVKETCKANPDEEIRFVACGGDGTVNEVFNGAVGFDKASVTVYPCGSGNDFVKAFGGAEKFMDLEKLATAPTRKLDLIKIGDRYSVNVTNFGFDTTVAITINKEREKTGHGNKNAYTKGVVTALIKSMRTKVRVIVDEEIINPDGDLLLCTLANGQYVGGSFRCAPKSEADDGLIDVCMVKHISRLRFVKLLGPYTAGEHIDNPEFADIIRYRRAKKIEVIANPGFAYSLDGEIIYTEHFVAEIAPAALNFAVPG